VSHVYQAGQLLTWIVGTAWATGIVMLFVVWALDDEKMKPSHAVRIVFWLPVFTVESLIFYFGEWRRKPDD
jgi:hypothetical protein